MEGDESPKTCRLRREISVLLYPTTLITKFIPAFFSWLLLLSISFHLFLYRLLCFDGHKCNILMIFRVHLNHWRRRFWRTFPPRRLSRLASAQHCPPWPSITVRRELGGSTRRARPDRRGPPATAAASARRQQCCMTNLSLVQFDRWTKPPSVRTSSLGNWSPLTADHIT